MVLYLDTDSEAKTGWLGYDFRVNHTRTADTASIERWNGTAWQPVAAAKWETRDRDLHLAVPRVAVGLANANTALRFDFKWADNLPESAEAARPPRPRRHSAERAFQLPLYCSHRSSLSRRRTPTMKSENPRGAHL